MIIWCKIQLIINTLVQHIEMHCTQILPLIAHIIRSTSRHNCSSSIYSFHIIQSSYQHWKKRFYDLALQTKGNFGICWKYISYFISSKVFLSKWVVPYREVLQKFRLDLSFEIVQTNYLILLHPFENKSSRC